LLDEMRDAFSKLIIPLVVDVSQDRGRFDAEVSGESAEK
jgi:hypothetical protein